MMLAPLMAHAMRLPAGALVVAQARIAAARAAVATHRDGLRQARDAGQPLRPHAVAVLRAKDELAAAERAAIAALMGDAPETNP